MRLLTQAFLLILLTVFMIVEPSSSMQAAKRGLTMWWQLVVPALLPFFIVSELLIRLQIVRHLGQWLNPVMKPVFNLPGAAGLALAMGYTSGFPVGAIVSSHLLQEKLLTREQASRLIAFTNNSSPLFIIGTIGVGILSNELYGYILAFAHYGSNLLVGWYLGRKNRAYSPDNITMPVIKTPTGNLLGASIRNSINNICQIGGFIIFFMVLTAFLSRIGFLDFMVYLTGQILPGLPPSLVYGSTIGLLELTQGSQAVGAAQAPILWKLLLLSTLLSISGLCIQAQIYSIVSEIGISFRQYLKARLLQIPPALVFTWLGWWLIAPVSTIANSQSANTPVVTQGYWEWLALLLVMLVLSGATNLFTYVFAGLTHRVRHGLNASHLVKSAPNKPINHRHIGWHHLQYPHLRFWPW
ncbi:MAG: sporulation integral membrane protein YlbJ [Methylocystaceae bacterium]